MSAVIVRGKPEQIPYARRMERFADQVWLIWSNKWSCWYRANSQGYTDHIDMAGLYTREKAAQHMLPRGTPKSHRDTEPFPISAVLKHVQFRRMQIEADYAEIDARLKHLEAHLANAALARSGKGEG